MPFKLFASHSQRTILLLSLGMFRSTTLPFFQKFSRMPWRRKLFLALSARLFLMLMFICILNFLLLLTHKKFFRILSPSS